MEQVYEFTSHFDHGVATATATTAVDALVGKLECQWVVEKYHEWLVLPRGKLVSFVTRQPSGQCEAGDMKRGRN
jgi:hypothetical protein